MKRRRGSLLAGSGILMTVSCAAIGGARAEGKPDAAVPVATSTVAAGLSAKDLELARYLDVLEHLDLLEDYECLELMPILEDDHEP